MSKSDLSYLAKCNYGEKAMFIVPRLDCARTIRTSRTNYKKMLRSVCPLRSFFFLVGLCHVQRFDDSDTNTNNLSYKSGNKRKHSRT